MGVNDNRLLISVIVPTCDRPALLREALASIRAIETDRLAFEILVGDNGTVPETRIVAETFGASWIKVNRIGAGAARNAALRAAKGEFIAFLDDDDVWLKDNVAPQVAMMRRDASIDAVFGQVISTDQELTPQTPPWPANPGIGDGLVRAMLSSYYPQLGATVVRATAARVVGLFDETLLGDQDWDWQLRLARRRRVGFTATPGVLFRQRPPGSFDKLRLTRVGFARKVFLRHALPEWKVFGNPVGLAKSYSQTLRQYFDYFVEAAVSRAGRGERAEARSALAGAFKVFPARTVFHVVIRQRLRSAALRTLLPSGKPQLGTL